MEVKQTFGTETSITITALASLANAATATSDEISNATNLYDEIILQIKVGGTAATTAWLDVRIYASVDGGTTWSAWTTPLHVLPAIDMSVDNPVYHARFVPPQRWKVAVKNNTGASLDAAGSTIGASYQGITYTGV